MRPKGYTIDVPVTLSVADPSASTPGLERIAEVVLEPLTWFCHRCFSVAEPPVFIRQEALCGLCACGVKREEL